MSSPTKRLATHTCVVARKRRKAHAHRFDPVGASPVSLRGPKHRLFDECSAPPRKRVCVGAVPSRGLSCAATHRFAPLEFRGSVASVTIRDKFEMTEHWFRGLLRKVEGQRVRVVAIDGGGVAESSPHLRTSTVGQIVTVIPFYHYTEVPQEPRVMQHVYNVRPGNKARSDIVNVSVYGSHWATSLDSNCAVPLLRAGDTIHCYPIKEVVTGTPLTQHRYAAATVGNCMLNPIRADFEAKYERAAAGTKATRQKTMQMCRRAIDSVDALQDEVGSGGVTLAQLQDLVDKFGTNPSVKIVMYKPCTLTKEEEWRIVSSKNTSNNGKVYHYLNSRKEHADLVDDAFLCDNPGDRHTHAELEDIIRTRIQDDEPVMWKQQALSVNGHSGVRVTSVYTSERIFSGPDRWASYNEWRKTENLQQFELDWLTQRLASVFVQRALHWNVRSQWLPNDIGRVDEVANMRVNGDLCLVDIERSYATSDTSPFYEGFPGRLTFMYACDTMDLGPGFYHIEDVCFDGADDKFAEICKRLGQPFKSHNVYARPVLRMLQSFGVAFKVTAGLWACGMTSTYHLRFPQQLIDSKAYASIVGLWAHVCEKEHVVMPGTYEWAMHLRATAPQLAKVFHTNARFGGPGEVHKEFPRNHAPHLMHWVAYINAYELIKQVHQLMEMVLSKVIQIKKDDIMCERHKFTMLPYYRDKTHKLPDDLSNVVLATEYGNPYTTGVLDFAQQDVYDDCVPEVLRLSMAHSSRFAHLGQDVAWLLTRFDFLCGAGGTGKTDFLLQLGALCPSTVYCVFNYRLMHCKLKEYKEELRDDEVQQDGFKFAGKPAVSLMGCVKDVLLHTNPERRKSFQKASLIVVDECQTLSCAEARMMQEYYPHARLVFCGDPEYQIPGIADGADENYEPFDGAELGLRAFTFHKIFRIPSEETRLLELRAQSRRLLDSRVSWEQYCAANHATTFPVGFGQKQHKKPGPASGKTFAAVNAECTGWADKFTGTLADPLPPDATTGVMHEFARYRHQSVYNAAPAHANAAATVDFAKRNFKVIQRREDVCDLYNPSTDFIICSTNACCTEWTQFMDCAGKPKKWLVTLATEERMRGEIVKYSRGEIVNAETPPAHGKLAHAFTVHKTIGMTCRNKLFIETRGVFQREMIETTLGRATRWENIYLMEVPPLATCTFSIYAIYSQIKALVYVGHTFNRVETRFQEHRRNDNKCSSKDVIAAADARIVEVERVERGISPGVLNHSSAVAEEVEGSYMTAAGLRHVMEAVQRHAGRDDLGAFRLVNEQRPGRVSVNPRRKQPYKVLKNGKVKLSEDIDYAKVDELIAFITERLHKLDPEGTGNGAHDKVRNVLTFLQRVRSRGSNLVEYSRKSHGLGRMYARDASAGDRGANLQGCYRGLRAALIGHVGHDVDMVNSLPAIIVQYVERHRDVLEVDDAVLEPLRQYIETRDAWLDELAAHHRISRADTKQLILVATFGGDPAATLSEMLQRQAVPHANLQRLVQCLAVIRTKVALHLRNTDQRFEKLYQEAAAETGAKATRRIFSIKMQDVEAQCIHELCKFLSRRGAQIYAIVHDGIIISTASLMREAEAHVWETCGYRISLVEKPLHGLQNDPVPELAPIA